MIKLVQISETPKHFMSSKFNMAIAMIATVLAMPAAAQEIHADLCLHGCPSGSPVTNDIIIRDIYILSSNDITKFADWVAYRVTRSTIGTTAERNWKPDPLLAENETLEPKDYRGAYAALSTDRGHQVPLASFTSTSNWELTNYLSNITPQKSALNRGVWLKLESAVRKLAEKPTTDVVYVLTGPLYQQGMPVLPNADESHLIPSSYWKIVITEKNGIIKLASFIFNQETERKASFCEERFITSIRRIEIDTSLNFFHALEAARQDELESGLNTLLVDLGCTS